MGRIQTSNIKECVWGGECLSMELGAVVIKEWKSKNKVEKSKMINPRVTTRPRIYQIKRLEENNSGSWCQSY